MDSYERYKYHQPQHQICWTTTTISYDCHHILFLIIYVYIKLHVLYNNKIYKN